VAAEGGLLAALQTGLTEDLVLEGLAREFVRRVQDLRKDSGLEVSDRIGLAYTASPRLAQAVEKHRDYIMAETLAAEMQAGPGPEGAAAAADTFDGEALALALVKQRVS
jgi:isoleucyl-tRNA synthetase